LQTAAIIAEKIFKRCSAILAR